MSSARVQNNGCFVWEERLNEKGDERGFWDVGHTLLLEVFK